MWNWIAYRCGCSCCCSCCGSSSCCCGNCCSLSLNPLPQPPSDKIADSTASSGLHCSWGCTGINITVNLRLLRPPSQKIISSNSSSCGPHCSWGCSGINITVSLRLARPGFEPLSGWTEKAHTTSKRNSASSRLNGRGWIYLIGLFSLDTDLRELRPGREQPSISSWYLRNFHIEVFGTLSNCGFFVCDDLLKKHHISRSAHLSPNFTNSEFQFLQFKVLQSVFFLLI